MSIENQNLQESEQNQFEVAQDESSKRRKVVCSIENEEDLKKLLTESLGIKNIGKTQIFETLGETRFTNIVVTALSKEDIEKKLQTFNQKNGTRFIIESVSQGAGGVKVVYISYNQFGREAENKGEYNFYQDHIKKCIENINSFGEQKIDWDEKLDEKIGKIEVFNAEESKNIDELSEKLKNIYIQSFSNSEQNSHEEDDVYDPQKPIRKGNQVYGGLHESSVVKEMLENENAIKVLIYDADGNVAGACVGYVEEYILEGKKYFRVEITDAANTLGKGSYTLASKLVILEAKRKFGENLLEVYGETRTTNNIVSAAIRSGRKPNGILENSVRIGGIGDVFGFFSQANILSIKNSENPLKTFEEINKKIGLFSKDDIIFVQNYTKGMNPEQIKNFILEKISQIQNQDLENLQKLVSGQNLNPLIVFSISGADIPGKK